MPSAILYVDDDQANLTVFEALCSPEFEVVTARNGAAALEVLRSSEVAILLTDQRMPGMSGAELSAIARTEFPDTLRYLVTAYSDLDSAVAAINDGHVRRYIRKPWDPAELRSALREGVELYGSVKRARELEQRMRDVERIYSLGVVTATIAHELRNPIGIVDLCLSLVDVELSKLDGNAASAQAAVAEMSKLLSNARGAAHRATEILRGIELTTRQRPDDASCDLGEILELTLRLVSGEITARARLDSDIAPLPRVRGSATRLGQVILNLLVNAAEALPDTGRAANHSVTVRARPNGDAVLISVEDTGVGIPPEVQAQVFDPFFTTKPDGGTGLGLAICKQIVEEVDGSISLRTKPGEGTCVEIRLPTADCTR